MRIKLSYEGKEVNPGDIVVVRPKQLISAWQAKEVFETTKKAFPDHHVVILPPDYYLETYDKEEFAKFLDHQRRFLENNESITE